MKEKSSSEGQMALFSWERCSPAGRDTNTELAFQLRDNSGQETKLRGTGVSMKVKRMCSKGCRAQRKSEKLFLKSKGQTRRATHGSQSTNGCKRSPRFFWPYKIFLTHERGCRHRLCRWGRVRGSGLKERHVGWKQQLAATVLTEENRQEDAGCAALVKG